MGLLTRQDLEKVGRMLSREGVRLEIGGDRAYCDTENKVVRLPDLPEGGINESSEANDYLRFFLDHEVGHLVGDSHSVPLDVFQRDHGEDGRRLLNALEDVRIEALMSAKWVGCGLNLRRGREQVVRRIYSNLSRQAGSGNRIQPLVQAIHAVYCTGSFLPMYGGLDDDLVLALMAKPVGEQVQSIPRWARCTADLVPLALTIRDRLRDLMQKQQEQQGEDKPQDGGAAADGGTDADDGEPSQDGGGESAGGNDQADPGDGTDADGGTDAGDGTGGAAADEVDVSQVAGDAIGKIDSGASDALDAGTTIAGVQDVELIHTTFEGSKLATNLDDKALEGVDLREVARSGGAAAQRLMSMLLTESRTWYRGGLRCGTPDPRRLAALAAGTSDRVLRRRCEQRSKSTHVHLLLDLSGSMRENRSGHTRGSVHWWSDRQTRAERVAKLAARLGHAMSICGVAFSASAYRGIFGSQQSEKRAEIVELHRPGRRAADLYAALHQYVQAGDGTTPTAPAMLDACKGLQASAADRRVLLVLTDGAPNGLEQGVEQVNIVAERFAGTIDVVIVGVAVQRADWWESLRCRKALASNASALDRMTLDALADALRAA